MKGEGRGRRGEREGLNKDNTVEKKREIEVSMFKDRNYRKEKEIVNLCSSESKKDRRRVVGR